MGKNKNVSNENIDDVSEAKENEDLKDAVNNANEVSKKDNNKLLIIIIVLLSLLVVGLGSYFVYDLFIANTNTELEKAEKKDKNKDKENINQEENTEVESKVYELNCSNSLAENGCSGKLTLDGKEVNVKTIDPPAYQSSDTYYDPVAKLEVDGKIIFTKEFSRGIKRVIAFKDLLIVETLCSNCGGSSAALPTIQVIDKNGKEIMYLYDFSDVKDKGYSLEIVDKKYNYSVKGNKIYMTASRTGYFADYGMLPNYACYIRTVREDGLFDGIDIDADNYEQYANEVVKIEYELEYLGNNKFAPAKKVKEIKFKDLYSKEHCIEEMKEIKKIKTAEGYY